MLKRFALALMGIQLFPVIALGATLPKIADRDLILQIKKTDFVFRSTLGSCAHEKIVQSSTASFRTFKFRAVCEIKPRPEEDCQDYEVSASGTYHNPESVTVRELTLKLICTA